MKKILAFRTDRLGDYLITSNILKELKLKYGHLTVVCSKTNYKLIKSQSFIDKIIIYDKNFSFLKKIKIFFDIFFNIYFLILAFDGKNFSLLASILLIGKKLCVSYKKKKNILGYDFYINRPISIISKIFFNKNITFSSRNILKKTEHLSTIYCRLCEEYIAIKSKKFYYEVPAYSKKVFKNIIHKHSLDQYILIHLDEKWLDIKDINKNFYKSILKLQLDTNKKIVISSFNNNHEYFVNFEENLKRFKPSNIILLKNLDIFLFERFINASIVALSCHSGYLVQVSGFNNAKILDLINSEEKLWVSCWIPPNENYKQIYKDNNNIKLSINEILTDIKNHI